MTESRAILCPSCRKLIDRDEPRCPFCGALRPNLWGMGPSIQRWTSADVVRVIIGTCIVLYAIGTDQIRGFAVTLILGILMSMYTAIFCSRVFFDIAERKRWITKLSMASILGSTHIDFIGKRKIARFRQFDQHGQVGAIKDPPVACGTGR